MTSRRGVLKLLGGGVVLAALGGGGFVVANGPSQSARQPWRVAGAYETFRHRALSYALLAPNPHNLQPWQVKLEGEQSLSLFHDTERKLPVTDPFDRQITIGCGAFLELLVMAAREEGYRADITPFPDGEDMTRLDSRPVARVDFVPGESRPDPLFAHVLDRRSNKGVYEARDVDPDALTELANAMRCFGMSAETVGNTATTERLKDLTWRAHLREMMTPDALRESVDLMRIGAREVSAAPDGIELEGATIAAGKLLGVVNRETLGDPASTAFRQGLDMYEKMARSARAFGWIVSDNQTRIDQLNAGRAYVRMNLTATALGLGVHPWSQALQEYAEMSDLYEEVHDIVGTDRRIQMLFRVGHARPVTATPRRGLDAHLV